MASYKTGSRFGSTQTEVYCYLFIIQETIRIVEIFFIYIDGVALYTGALELGDSHTLYRDTR